MPYLEDHTLYYKKSCPYCQKVLRFMQDNKINLDMRDTLQPGNQNDLIHIGKPIEMDVQEFFKQLEVLAAYGYANSEKIRDIVAAIVPTYHSADSDLKLHKKVYEELMSEAAVAAEK